MVLSFGFTVLELIRDSAPVNAVKSSSLTSAFCKMAK